MLHSVTKAIRIAVAPAAFLPGFCGSVGPLKFSAISLPFSHKKHPKYPDSGASSIYRMADITALFHAFCRERRFIFWFFGNFCYQLIYFVCIAQRFDKRLQTERIFFPCGKAESIESA